MIKINKLAYYVIFFIMAFLALFSAASLSADGKRNLTTITALNLVSTDWCPYTCDNLYNPGFVTEALRQVLENNGISLSVTILPWTRAIKMTEQGKYDGLIIALPSEVSGFHLTEKASGHNNNCLFSLPDSSFVFQDRGSLSGLVLGGIQDYRYGKPIDDIIDDPMEDEQVYLLSSSTPLFSLVEMIYKNRIDIFAEDSLVLGNYLKSHKNRPLKNIGCLERAPLFTAISPRYTKHKEVLALLNELLDSDAYKSHYQQAKLRYTAP